MPRVIESHRDYWPEIDGVFSSRLMPPETGPDPISRVFDLLDIYVKPKSRYFDGYPRPEKSYRLILVSGPFTRTISGSKRNTAQAIIFRELEEVESERLSIPSEKNYLRPDDFNLLKGIALEDLSEEEFTIQDSQIRMDLFHLKQLARRGKLNHRKRT